MERFIIYLLIAIISGIFSVFTAYYCLGVFLEKKRLQAKYKYCCLVLIIISSFTTNLNLPRPFYEIRTVLSFALILIMALVIYSGKLSLKFFVSFLIVSFGGVSETAVYAILSYISDSFGRISIKISILYFDCGCISNLMLLLAAGIIKKILYLKHKKPSSESGMILIVIPLLSTVVILKIFVDSLIIPSMNGNITAVVATLCMLLVDILIYVMFEKLAEHSKAYLKLKLAEQQLKTQENHYAQLMENRHNIMRLIHDEKNHLLCISALAEESGCQSIKEYIDNLRGSYRGRSTVDTGHPVVDAVIDEKKKIAKESGIKMELKILLPTEIGIENSDLCVILGNALDNAIEACKRLERNDTEKTIEIMLCIKNRHFVASITNPVDYGFSTDRLVTSKANRELHGYGLRNIKQTVKKYGGNVQIMVSNDRFKLNIAIPLIKN